MKFPITLMSLILAGMFLCISQPTFAKMGTDVSTVEQQVKKNRKLSFKERMAKRIINKKIKKIKKVQEQAKTNSSDTTRWILIIAGILIAITLLGYIGGLVGQILSILIFAIVLVFILQLLGVI